MQLNSNTHTLTSNMLFGASVCSVRAFCLLFVYSFFVVIAVVVLIIISLLSLSFHFVNNVTLYQTSPSIFIHLAFIFIPPPPFQLFARFLSLCVSLSASLYLFLSLSPFSLYLSFSTNTRSQYVVCLNRFYDFNILKTHFSTRDAKSLDVNTMHK